MTETFFNTGGEQTFVVPAGITSIEVAAIGGKGGDAPLTGGGATQGGDAAEVIGTISVTPGQTLYIEVGGNGSDSDITAEGGFNGGGAGGGGGGGASDVRTSPLSVDLETEDTRLIVAGGGGGAGGEGPEEEGGAGGNAGAQGAATIYAGGGAGSQTEGGAGGVGCFEAAGGNGGLGFGGDGADVGEASGPGGGGGGGYYGGGGGAASCEFGSSGGGGGSSLVPPGGEEFLATGEEPLVELTYTIPTPPPTPKVTPPSTSTPTTPVPDTIIGAHPKKVVKTKKAKAKVKFGFSASVAGATFKCKLDKGAFAPCSSPKTYKVKAGKHKFSVVAETAGGADQTPATYSFKVVKKKS